jgi:hypothetical protein
MRRVGTFLAVIVSLAVGPVSGAGAAPVVTVSGPSPYAGCSDANQPGTVYNNAEVEPQVAVNPANTNNVIGAWQQDRWSNGGAHGLVAGFSSDGGASWGETPLPFSICAANAIDDPFTGAPYNRASDPWVSIGPDGTAYAVGLLATNSTLGVAAGTNDTGVATVTSSNGGQTWENPHLERADQGTTPVFEFTHFFNDKESVTADPTHAGTAYVVWDRLQAPSFTPDAALRAHAFRGPTWFSKTTDGGKTWTTARPIFDPGQNSQTIGNIVVADPRDGTLYDFFEQFSTTGSPKFTPRGNSVSFVKSTDGGNTWSRASVVSAEQTAADVDPNTGAPLRTGEALPSVAIDASTGELYTVWEDARFTGGAVNQVVISTSTDGGRTWTDPAAVSGSSSNGTPAFTPTIAVNSAGTVGVTYYDTRNLTPGDTTTLPTDVWLTTSPAPTGGKFSFGNETHVAGSFNMLVAPNAGGFFVGDYEGLSASGSVFMPFFVQTNCTDNSCTSNRTDVYTGSF